MKAKFIIPILAAAAVVGIGLHQLPDGNVGLSDLTIENIEALTQEEGSENEDEDSRKEVEGVYAKCEGSMMFECKVICMRCGQMYSSTSNHHRSTAVTGTCTCGSKHFLLY